MNKAEKTLSEDKINNFVLDLNAATTGQINEGGFLRMFGWGIEKILNLLPTLSPTRKGIWNRGAPSV